MPFPQSMNPRIFFCPFSFFPVAAAAAAAATAT